MINNAERLYNQYRIECNTLADWVKSKVAGVTNLIVSIFRGMGYV